MKHCLALFAALLVSFSVATAGELSSAEAKALRSEVTRLYEATKAGNIDVILSSTHRSLKEMMGGEANFQAVTRQAVNQLLELGIKFVDVNIGEPSRTHEAGTETVSFVPMQMTLEVQGKTVKSKSFMIAIRPTSGGAWTFLDSAALRSDPTILKKLLPKLPESITLPENSVSVVE